jgi:hypothetical protein
MPAAAHIGGEIRQGIYLSAGELSGVKLRTARVIIRTGYVIANAGASALNRPHGFRALRFAAIDGRLTTTPDLYGLLGPADALFSCCPTTSRNLLFFLMLSKSASAIADSLSLSYM